MPIKILLLIIAGIVASNVFAQGKNKHKQEFECSFETYVKGGLFYDLANPLTFPHNSKSAILFSSSESAVIQKISNYELTVQPKNRNDVTLYAIDSISKDTLLKRSYRVRHVPSPDLHLGNVTDSMQIHLLPNVLVSWQFTEYVPTTCHYNIISGIVRFQNYEFPFTGDRIPEEIVVELYKLRQVYQINAFPVQLEAVVLCPTCAQRRISRTFFLI